MNKLEQSKDEDFNREFFLMTLRYRKCFYSM